MDINARQTVEAVYVGHSEQEYGPFKGRDGETVHGFNRYVYLADDGLSVTELKVRDEDLHKQALGLKLGHRVKAEVELVAQNTGGRAKLLPVLRALHA